MQKMKIRVNNMKRYILIVKIILLLFFFIGCEETTHSFIKKDINPSGRIAVIMAEAKYPEVDMAYAEKLELQLSKLTKFSVVSQKQIKSIIPGYPEKIAGPYNRAFIDNIYENYSKTDKKSLFEMAEKLKADYIYVVWIATGTENERNPSRYHVYMITQLFEYPSTAEIAHGKFDVEWCPSFHLSVDLFDVAFDKLAVEIVNDIGKNTKSLKN
jgi:hypothetical protein